MKLYLSSVLVWLIILKMTNSFCKDIVSNRKDVDYKEYTKGKTNNTISYTVISFIPIMRLFWWIIMLFVSLAPKEILDKVFKREE